VHNPRVNLAIEMTANNGQGYSNVAISLHWLMFAFILSNWSLGLYMVELPLSPQKLKLFSWHKWLGVTVFLVAVLRITWRLTHPAPPFPDVMPAWQRTAANLSHHLLYLLLFLVPLSGWLYSSASGVPTVYLGLMQLPDLVSKDKQMAELLKIAHVSLNITLFFLVCLHAAAALKHHFLDRDDILTRMLPFLKTTRNRFR
jgi:cytochrome b561